jgi:hypothetical protein
MIQILLPLELVSHLHELFALETRVTKALGCLPMMLNRMLSFLLEIALLYRVLGFLTAGDTPLGSQLQTGLARRMFSLSQTP